MSNGFRRIELVRSPNAGLAFTGPWVQRQAEDELSGYTVTSSGLMSFSFEGSEVHLTGHYTVPLGQERATPTLNCYVDEQLTTINYGVEGVNAYSCSWNGTDATDGAHSFRANLAFPVGAAGDDSTAIEASIDSIRYLPSATNPEFLTQGASVLYGNTDPHIDYAGAWETLRENGEVVSVATRQGAAMTAVFTGNSVTWYGWLPAGSATGQSSASYSIDGGEPVTFQWDRGASTRRREEFFRVEGLSIDAHNLTVVHQDSQSGPPLILDYLLVDNGKYRIEAERPSPSTLPVQDASSSNGTPPSDTPPPSSPPHKPPIGGIVGGVIGALAVVVLAVLAFLWIRMKKKARNDHANSQPRTTISLSHPGTLAPPTVYRKGDVPAFTAFTTSTEETSQHTRTPVDNGSVNPLSLMTSSPTSDPTIRRKGEEVASSGQSMQASESSSTPRQHQDSGIRLNSNRRSSLPPVYTAE
ncbi:hypothetical protein BKA70DRAFT_1520723 [Coprinopsis sp. MPI-PUGE-AT-0042]|nr:hypothetical protein BKA70DRAFT_1520723 [Coprinopsis sp. MPI-PUGE-AT-0042]